MTNPIATVRDSSTAPNSPLGGDSVALRDLLVGSPAVGRGNVNAANLSPSYSTGRLASEIGKAPVVKQSAKQIEAAAQAYADMCWKKYAAAYPEAFSARSGLSTKAPTLVFARTQAEFDRAFGPTSASTKDMIAFVKTGDPSKIYIHPSNLVKYVNQYGPNYLKTTISHELVHCLTNPVSVRMRGDAKGETESYKGVAGDLALKFDIGVGKSVGAVGAFSIQQLLMESSAERYATQATGLGSFSEAYSPIRAMGEKLVQLVGEKVFRKAMIENDPTAYRRVIAGAKVLQAQNLQDQQRQTRTTAVGELRAAQTAAPFGTPMTAKTLAKIESRYFVEYQAHAFLQENYPDQVKNFDFRFLNAVNANLKRGGKSYDPEAGESSQRDVSVSIRAVWPRLVGGAK